MTLEQFVRLHKPEIDGELERLLPQPMGEESVLYQAMRYSVFAGGKRLRPSLFMAVLAALGKDSQPYLPFACSLEMIHTYSLIHDDLPAMDNDDLRRGQPTCHKAFDEAQAILAGDALLTYAFNCMIKVAPHTAATALVAAIDEVAAAAGLRGMIVGQVVDVLKEGQPLDEAQLRYIHEHKTGALFEASLVSAALLAEAAPEQIAVLRQYAAQIGLVFQIADDILDVVGDEAKLGKHVGSDEKNHKTTYVTLCGLEGARARGWQAVREAQALVAPWGEAGELLAQVPQYFMERES